MATTKPRQSDVGRFLYHDECPDCGSSDALGVYQDNSGYCFSCQKFFKDIDEITEEIPLTQRPSKLLIVKQEEQEVTQEKQQPRVTPLAKNFPPIEDRSIDSETAQKFQVRAVLKDELPNVRHVYPYFDKHGNHVANKCRTKFEKGFFVEGNLSNSALFGQQAFPPGGKSLTITEGELDALSVYQMFGHKYPVVSVKGASSAVKDIVDNYEYVNSFDEIVLCFDTDEEKKRPDGTSYYPGQDAAKKVAEALPLGKVRIVTLQKGKDANEYLQKGLGEDFKKEWWKAPIFTPQGIRLGKDLWEEIKAPKNYETVPYPWDGLNALTYGLRLSEFVVVTANTGIGKTSVLKEIEHYILNHTKSSIGLLHLEETNADTALGLMSIEANKALHLPDIREKVNDEELKAYFDRVVNSERVIIYDHFGSNAIDDLLNKIRHMAALGAKWIILDHLSIVVSDQSGDERKQLDEVSTKIKTLCMELNICVIAVIHQNRNGEIRGTAGVEQLANIVIKLLRDIESENDFERNVTKVLVQKNRFSGKTGPAAYLHYSSDTGRLVECSEDQVKQFEESRINEKDKW